MHHHTKIGLVSLLLGFLSLLMVVLVIPRPTPEAFAATDTAVGYGAYLSTRFNDSQRRTLVAKLKEFNAGITRQEFNYQNIGGASGSNFGPDDDAVTVSRDNGIQVLAFLSFSSRPSIADWKSFVGNVAAHFKGKVVGYEIMNEPNDPKSVHNMSPSDYKSYLQASFEAIRAADSGATVVTGAVVGDNSSWTEELFLNGGASFTDAIGFHPYKDDNPELNRFGIEDVTGHLRQLIAVDNRLASGKPIWVTEFGWLSAAVGADTQANYLSREVAILRSFPEVQKIITYNLVDDSTGSWGILNSDFSAKTAASRLSDTIKRLGAGTVVPHFPAPHDTIGNFDSDTDSFGTDQTNGTISLDLRPDGYLGHGLNINYNFTAPNANVIATRPTALPGSPSGIGLWVNGDNSRNLLLIRITDAQGETFQYTVGTTIGGWHFMPIDLNNSLNRISFNGDGVIQYPIAFNSIVINRHSGGGSNGTIGVDEIVSITDQASVRAVRSGDTVAFWNAGGAANSTICGNAATATEAIQYVGVDSNCPNWTAAAKLASSAPATAQVTKKTTSSCKVVKGKRVCTVTAVKTRAKPAVVKKAIIPAKKAPIKKAPAPAKKPAKKK